MRALSLARYLPENGVRVDVLTARNAPAVVRDDGLLAQLPASVTVHRTWTLDLPFALRKGMKKLLSRERPRSTQATKTTAKTSDTAATNPLRQAVANLLLPDPQIGWLPFASRAAARLVRERQINAVIITVPPFSSVKLAEGLRKKFPKLTILLDFRDEWLNTTLNLVSLNANARARAVAWQTERAAVRAATAVVAVTDAARDAIHARYPAETAEKFVRISNGFDGPLPSLALQAVADPRPAGTPVKLTYLGSIYGSTDPATFVQAVLGLPDELRTRLRVRFIGHFENPAYRDTVLQLGSTVELIGFLPQADALRLLDETDYVLLISHDPVNVSAKFYDYLRSGKPVLAAVHPGGDVRRRLKETRAGAWADVSDAAAIREMLARVIQHGLADFDPDYDAIARYHRKPLAAQYAGLLTALTASQESRP